jgi:hypothetical protein
MKLLMSNEGSIRDDLIIKWCESVWAAYEDDHAGVINLVKRELWSRKD